MRITYANIPASANKFPQPSTSAAKAPVRPHADEARDRYTKNSEPQFIDAEYVEFYSPSVDIFDKERKTLDYTLEPDKSHLQYQSSGQANNAPAINKYQLKAHEAPPPGTYLDIFA